MKRLLPVLLLSALCTGLFAAASPKIYIEKSVHDVGEISKDTQIKRIIRIDNVGEGRLVITKARSGCDCVTVSILKDTAEKSSPARIEFVLDTSKDIEAEFTKYIYIQSNDPDRPVSRVTITGSLKESSPYK